MGLKEEKPAGADPDEGSKVEAGNGHSGATPKAKKGHRRWPIVVGVVAVVLVVAGAGFWTWHEQPSFCNAVCHQPMDPYVEGYYENDQLLAYTHQVGGATCLECHEAKIDEQIGEACAWVSGDYTTDENGMISTVGVRADSKMCTNSGCHSVDDIVAATADYGGEQGVNPHDSHQGYALDCSSCHTVHGQSVMYCNTCHDYEVPAGWTEPVKSANAAA